MTPCRVCGAWPRGVGGSVGHRPRCEGAPTASDVLVVARGLVVVVDRIVDILRPPGRPPRPRLAQKSSLAAEWPSWTTAKAHPPPDRGDRAVVLHGHPAPQWFFPLPSQDTEMIFDRQEHDMTDDRHHDPAEIIAAAAREAWLHFCDSRPDLVAEGRLLVEIEPEFGRMRVRFDPARDAFDLIWCNRHLGSVSGVFIRGELTP